MTRYKIGDKVVTTDGVVGEIRDVLYSAARNTNLILIKPEDGGKVFTREESEVELYNAPVKYSAEIEYHTESIVVARVYRVNDSGKKEISCGYGKVYSSTDYDFAQAASFALKIAYLKLKEGKEAE